MKSLLLFLMSCLSCCAQVSASLSNTVVRTQYTTATGLQYKDVWFTGSGRTYQLYVGSFIELGNPTTSSITFSPKILGDWSVTLKSDSKSDGIIFSDAVLPWLDNKPRPITFSYDLNGYKFAAVDTLGSLIISRESAVNSSANFSCRTILQANSSSTLGFVVSEKTRWYLIRGVGVSLAGFGVKNVVPLPEFTVFNSAAAVVAKSTPWSSTVDSTALFNDLFKISGAFSLNSSSNEHVFIGQFSPGNYTVEFSNTTSQAGTCLLEVYALPFALSEN